MPRYRLTIAYDGTDFCGWQKQEPPLAEAPRVPGGGPTDKVAAYSADTPLLEPTREGRAALRTVQGVVERAVREVVREPVEVLGASRTDSGVHARGQVAAFTCEPRDWAAAPPDAGVGGGVPEPSPTPAPKGLGWPLERGTDRLVAAINSRLPEDVMVVSAAATHNHFDPVSDAVRKVYTYTYHFGRERPLWDRRYVHHVMRDALDHALMHDAAQALVGEHDFAAFAAAGHGRLTTVRRVISCGVARVDDRRVRMTIVGTGFLWNMVRIIAGTLMQVGAGQRSVADVRAALESRDRTKAGPTLGPEGLCLEWIEYAVH